jgi:hypothetical protein
MILTRDDKRLDHVCLFEVGAIPPPAAPGRSLLKALTGQRTPKQISRGFAPMNADQK